MEETHDDAIKEKRLPRVGQIVRSRKYGTLWRVIEKKEVYQNAADDLETEQPRQLRGGDITENTAFSEISVKNILCRLGGR